MQIQEHYVEKRAMEMEVQGKGRRRKPKRRWLDSMKDDIRENELSGEEMYRVTYISSYIDPA